MFGIRSKVGLLAIAVGLALPHSAVGGALQPEPASALESTDCGPVLRKASGVAWRCVFADSFNGDSLDRTLWQPLLTSRTGRETPECRIDSPNVISVGNGRLRLSARHLDSAYECATTTGSYQADYVGGGVTTRQTFAQTYGRFEIRAKMPYSRGSGLHSALWMWPRFERHGSQSGEIDIAEWRSGYPKRVVPTIHYDDEGRDLNRTNWKCYIPDAHRFHTYTLVWNRRTMTFLYDGKVCLRAEWHSASGLTKPAPFDEPFYLILNQAVGGGYNKPIEREAFPGTMAIDYVRVWK